MLRHYMLVSLRHIRKFKGYAVINIAGLAIGIAGSLLILLYIQYQFGYDRFHPLTNRIYRVVNGTDASTPSALGPALMEAFPEVVQTTRFGPPSGIWMMKYQNRVFGERFAYLADSSVFQIFSFPLLAGDPRTALNDPSNVVISEDMARKYFGDEDPMGKIIRADDAYDLRVTGIMKNVPAQSHVHMDFLFAFDIQKFWGDSPNDWYDRGYYTYILLTEGYDPTALEAKFPGFLKTYVGARAASFVENFNPAIQPLTSIHLHSHLANELGVNGDISSIYLLISIAVFLIVIASINFINLATARSLHRMREVGVRKVVGAHRRQLILQFFGESVLLVVGAVALSLIAVELALPAAARLLNIDLAQATESSAWWGGLLVVTVITSLTAGLYPAVYLSAFHPVMVLKGAGTTRTGSTLRTILVVVQFTLSIVCLIGISVMADQMEYIKNKRLGFTGEQVLVIPSSIAGIFQKYETFRQAVTPYPGVVNMTIASTLPGRTGGTGSLRTLAVEPEGAMDGRAVATHTIGSDFNFVKTLGITVVAGRDFSSDFAADVRGETCLLNESAVARYGWASPAEAIGKQMHIRQWQQRPTVVGVVGDFHLMSLHSPIEPLIITRGGITYIGIRIRAERMVETVDFIGQKWREVYPMFTFDYTFLDEDIGRLYRTETTMAVFFRAFALLTLLIACLGLIGLTALTVTRRTKEIGIRKILGASVVQIVRLLSREFLILVIIANIIAWPIAYVAMQWWLRMFAYRVDPSPVTFVAVSLLALIIAIVTVGLRTIKAARANPVDALRYE